VARQGLTGVLLVGGASTRFGSPKALARLEGETLAERAWRLLGETCDERLATGKLADGLRLPFPFLDDEATVRAPLAGVVAGLRAARHDVCVVLPVDCPGVRPGTLRALAAACADAAVTQTGPLPGAYRRTVLPVLERRLAALELSLRDALAGLDVRVVDVELRELANVNTPEELARAYRDTQGPTPPTRSTAMRSTTPGGGSSMGGNFTSGPR
jgi:molybdopterin-guanine dinucleotide biosynthesis protein A